MPWWRGVSVCACKKSDKLLVTRLDQLDDYPRERITEPNTGKGKKEMQVTKGKRPREESQRKKRGVSKKRSVAHYECILETWIGSEKVRRRENNRKRVRQ